MVHNFTWKFVMFSESSRRFPNFYEVSQRIMKFLSRNILKIHEVFQNFRSVPKIHKVILKVLVFRKLTKFTKIHNYFRNSPNILKTQKFSKIFVKTNNSRISHSEKILFDDHWMLKRLSREIMKISTKIIHSKQWFIKKLKRWNIVIVKSPRGY